MKVLVAQPPMKNMVIAFSPPFMHENVGIQPPMGLINIATYMEQNSDHDIEVMDCQINDLNHEGFVAEVERFKPDVLGIGTTTMTFYDAWLAAKSAKEALPGLIVVLGGPTTSVYPKETIQHDCFDFLLEGEGDIRFTELVNLIATKCSVADVKGLYYVENGEVVYTGSTDFIEDLNSLPIPNRHLTDYNAYFSALTKRRPATNMMTSRGCPFPCTFCDRMGKSFRPRSVENVLAEMSNCVDMGIQEIAIYDDTFTIQRERVIAICQGIIDEGWDFIWNIRTRLDVMDQEMLDMLKKAGCSRIHYGLEAGNEEIRNQVLRKEFKQTVVKDIFDMTHDAGIETYTYLMIGSPGEGEKEIQDTIDLVRDISPDYAAYAITTPMPNTELHKLAIQQGVYEESRWLEYIHNPTARFVPPIWDKELSVNRLQELQLKAYKKFYGRPSQLLKKAFAVRSFKELAVKTKIAKDMFLAH